VPYIHEWVEPELFMEHNGVRIYHSYKDDQYDHLLEYHFQVQLTDETEGTTEDDMWEFDVRDLETWRVEQITVAGVARYKGDPGQAIRDIIGKGGRDLIVPMDLENKKEDS